MITHSVLSRVIKKGNLTWTHHNGIINHYGDGSGDPIKIRTTKEFSEIKLLLNPSIQFGESYMNGSLIIDEGRIHDLLKLLFTNSKVDVDHWIMHLSKNIRFILNKFSVGNYLSKSKNNVAHHYDLSDRLYELFLDQDRQYSCAYFNSPNDTLDQAQTNKKELIAKKLLLTDSEPKIACRLDFLNLDSESITLDTSMTPPIVFEP